MQLIPICRPQCRRTGKVKYCVIRSAWRNGCLVGKRTPRPWTCTAYKQTNIVCQIKSASCSLSLRRRLFTGTSSSEWNSRKRTLKWVVIRMVKSCTDSRQRHPTKDAFESLVHTSSLGADHTERTARGFSGASPSRLQLMKSFKHSWRHGIGWSPHRKAVGMTFVKPWGISSTAVTGRVNIDTNIGCCRPQYQNTRYWINNNIGYYPKLNPILNPILVFCTCWYRDTLYWTSSMSGHPILIPILIPITGIGQPMSCLDVPISGHTWYWDIISIWNYHHLDENSCIGSTWDIPVYLSMNMSYLYVPVYTML